MRVSRKCAHESLSGDGVHANEVQVERANAMRSHMDNTMKKQSAAAAVHATNAVIRWISQCHSVCRMPIVHDASLHAYQIG